MLAQRMVAATTLAFIGIAVPDSSAATPCGAIKDPRGDVAVDVFTTTGVQGNAASLDIIAGAIAGTSTGINAEFRVVGPIKADRPLRGYRYSARFVLGGSDTPEEFELVAMITPNSQTFSVYRQDQGGGSGLGRYVQGFSDLQAGRVALSVDVPTLQTLSSQDLSAMKGRSLSSLSITSGSVVGESAVAGVTADGDDQAGTSRTIIIGSQCQR